MTRQDFEELGAILREMDERLLYGTRVVGGDPDIGLVQLECDDAAFRRYRRLIAAANRGMRRHFSN